jgi:guanylate kinase
MEHTTSPAGKLVLIVGPSGVGKTTLLNWLSDRHPEFHFARSATTRPRRPGEGDEEYIFLTESRFDELLRAGKFLEWATVHGGARYGTLLDDILPPIERGRTVVRVVDVQGFDSIRRHPLFAGPAPRCRLWSVFLLPQSMEQLAAHIQRRQPAISTEELQRRLESAQREMHYADLCDFKVVNAEGRADEAWQQVETFLMRQDSG